MNRNKNVNEIAISGLLTALGILIPMMMPLKLILPASTYTLASHVPIMIAMFVSPKVGIMVALGTTFGFYVSLGPIVAARAFSHLAFVIPGALYLRKHRLDTFKDKLIFNIVIALIHGFAELAIVSLFTMKALNAALFYQYVLFLGFGTILHSCVDFILALGVVGTLNLDN